MQSSSSQFRVTGIAQQLSTRTSLFSTRYAHAIHVRDLVFVKHTPASTYLGTGADSRVDLASAPAMKMPARFARVQSDLESLALVRSLPLLSPHTRLPRHAPRATRHALTV